MRRLGAPGAVHLHCFERPLDLLRVETLHERAIDLHVSPLWRLGQSADLKPVLDHCQVLKSCVLDKGEGAQTEIRSDDHCWI
jgi:hypothetical protein